MTVDKQLQRKMRDLGHALLKAIAASPEVGHAMREIRHQGYSLYLVLDPEEGENGARIELTAGRKTPSEKPVYLLNQGDVSFLESVGIDATRPGRRRRC